MGKTNVRYYLTQLSNHKVNKQSLMIEILSSFSYQELVSFKEKVPRVFQGILKMPYLKRKSFSDIFKTGKILWSGSTDLYGSIAFIIQNNALDINRYIELKEQLDYATVIKQYDVAYSLLEQIEQNVSISMTGTYYLLKLTRLDKGITASTQLHNSICEKNRSLSYLATIALKSASVDMPFEAEIEHLFRSLKGDELVNDFITAFAFPYKEFKEESWLRFLPYTSIIDLYEGFILQLGKLTPSALKDKHLQTLISELASCIKDIRLKRFNELLTHGQDGERKDKYEETQKIIELYYKGDYQSVMDEGSIYLKKHPLQSTILDLFIRSCIKLDSIPDLFPEDSLVGKVYYLSIMASTDDEAAEICKTQLRNICMAWYSIPGFRYLYTLFEDIDKTRKGSVYKKYWAFSLVPEVRDSCFFDTPDEAVLYLTKMGYRIESSSQIAILQGENDDTYNQTRRLLNGIEDKDIQTLWKAIEESAISPIIVRNIVSQLFDRLTEIGKYDEAISLFVRFKLKNPNTKIYIDRQRINQVMTDDRDRGIHNQLELSAFYTMINSDVYKRYLAYKRYLKAIGVNKASEIKDVRDVLRQFFIGKVADRSVLTLHVRQFETEEDVDTERIELCKKMFNISNDKVYADEITSLIKEHEVKALAQEVNDSKIHVDVQSLINSEFDQERLMFETYQEIDENLVMFEQKNWEGLVDYLQKQYEGKAVYFSYELPAVKYKKVLFHELFLSVRDKFLFDPRYGLDKYLSARIRHGTLITQLRNHFLAAHLVTNKIEGGEYIKTSQWTQREDAVLSDSVKDKINMRLLQFTEWLDDQLREVKEERVQIQTERNSTKDKGLFDYSEELMTNEIDALEINKYDSFDAFIHSAIGLLWRWTGDVLRQVRQYLNQFQDGVLEEMVSLQNDILPMMSGCISLANSFKNAITSCRTEFQSDISVVTNWFKPEQSKVRFFSIQQAVETSLSVINKINQNALSFNDVSIKDSTYYSGRFFNAFHDIFHDMMNNILGYEAKRPKLKGKGKISTLNNDGVLTIIVSNPVDKEDISDIEKILHEQQNFQSLIAGGKTRREKNSGCVKIYSTVMYTLSGISYENKIDKDCFIATIKLNSESLEYNENSVS